jgi:hypothetical protein
MVNKIISSLDNNHEIQISIIDEIAWFNINKLDYNNIKSFLYLVKDIMEIFRNNKIKNIKQYIGVDSIKFFTNSSIIELENDIYIVNSDIEIFLDELVNALGLIKA